MRFPSVLFALAVATRLEAQVALHAAELLAEPGGRPIATVRAGARMSAGVTRGAFTQVTVEGYLGASVLGAPRDSFPVSVRPAAGARLRAEPEPGASVVADLGGGVGLARAGSRGEWVLVRRAGWIASSALSDEPLPEMAAAVGSEAAGGAPGALALTGEGSLAAARATVVQAAPGGGDVATLTPGARLTPIGREKGWVRVRVEGWVPERDLTIADTALGAALSAADLRADPEGTHGKVVRWDVQKLAFQVADPFRRDMAPEEPYLLARGPGAESALLYLAVPASLVEAAKAVPDLALVTVIARVRNGRSEPVGVPILDVQSIVRR